MHHHLSERITALRSVFKRPLTLTEKVLYSHLCESPSRQPERGRTMLELRPDRVAMQDATAQMALLQFMVTGLETVAVPASIHCDHLVRAQTGAKEDLDRALKDNAEVYHFLKSAAALYGLDFWEPGSGIIHQVVLEQYSQPGSMIIGTDSHTPNGGGIGMIAIGVGGADAVDVMAGQPFELVAPKLIGIKLTGKLGGWAAPKDVILKIAGLLTVRGGTGCIIEYFGPGVESLSCTGRATITNMGAELGATTSIFPCDQRSVEYLSATGRQDLASEVARYFDLLQCDSEVSENPDGFFDQLLEIDLSRIEAAWVGPHSPDLFHDVSEVGDFVHEKGYPDGISAALIGSCTNSSYEDVGRAAHVASQAVDAGLQVRTPLMVTPGSDQVFKTVERDGYLEPLRKAGATVLANACGPCIGQWKRSDQISGKENTIVTSYNRNFPKRNDGNATTLAFVGSPELVTAAAFAGKLSFNPLSDAITTPSGREFRFLPPEAKDLPGSGFLLSKEGYCPPPELEKRQDVRVEINPDSERLAVLKPFAPWQVEDFLNLVVLAKAEGKCTTDHISQAGPWLRFRGHLDKISDNLFLGLKNADSGETGTAKDAFSEESSVSLPQLARRYYQQRTGWIIVGDENYGEGSSREHAAMEPRHLGCRAVVARSFARIHETNLKKQGVLPLVFVNEADYLLLHQAQRVELHGLEQLEPSSELELQILEGERRIIKLSHSLTARQIKWFWAGSALNYVARNHTSLGYRAGKPMHSH